MNAYLLLYDRGIDHPALRKVLDNDPNIKDWFKAFPSSYFIVSNLDANKLIRVFSTVMNGANFFITQIETDPAKTNGLMSAEDWDFILYPMEG